jgi:putative protease
MRTKIDEIRNGKRIITKKPELLAPAGDLEKLKIAIQYGADAVFIGGREFGLRANAGNFSLEDIKEACDFANEYNAKIYITTNIIAHESDFEGLEDYLIHLEEAGVTGVIVADLMIIEAAERVAPKLEIHISTQQSIINYETIKFYEEIGAHRVVLAREANEEEIREMMAETDTEIEVFIHGSMCISYSGRCTLSNHLTMRDSNRGGCSQSCRWEFDMYEDDKKINANNEAQFAMSPNDLLLLDYIPNMIELGVDSLKIEGRMRSIHYIATVVSTYRKLIDDYCANPASFVLDEKYHKEIMKSANRTFSAQYFNGMPTKDEQMFDHRDEHPTQQFIGLVLDYDEETKIATIQQRNHFKVGQKIEFFGPEIETTEMLVTEMWDEDGNELDVARHPKQVVKLRVEEKIYKNNMLRKVL